MAKQIIYNYTEKSLDVYRNAHRAKYRFFEGAVRAAKSFTANDLAIKELQHLPAGDVLVSGYSISSVARNVIAEWKKIIDPHSLGLFKTVREGKDEYLQINWRGLSDKKFYIRGAGTEADYKQIQGATFVYWYGDEMTRHNKTFVQMAMTRLSMPCSLACWTANPDSPYHYIKTDYLDNKALFEEDEQGWSEFRRWTFFLEDNPSLSMKYIRSLKNFYKGVFFKRYILAQWVAAEGTIYDMFDEDEHVITPEQAPKALQYYVALDYGSSNATAVGLYGVNMLNPTIKLWLVKHWYYDCQAPENYGRKLSDHKLVKKIAEFIRGFNVTEIIADPSALSLKIALDDYEEEIEVTVVNKYTGKKEKKKIVEVMPPVTNGDNAVLDGIRTQGRLIDQGTYKIVNDPSNEKVIKDYFGYRWDEDKAMKGEDVPVKTEGSDHTKDGERYMCHTLFGEDILDYTRLCVA